MTNMVKDLQANPRNYIRRILQVRVASDAVILLKLIRRVLPALVRKNNWRALTALTRAVARADKASGLYSKASGSSGAPLAFAFKDCRKEIYAAYEKGDDETHALINDIVLLLGKLGMNILLQILTDSEVRTARLSALGALIKMGEMTRSWVIWILDDPASKWYLKRNALLLLKQIAKTGADISRAHKLVSYGHPRVRDEALKVLISLDPGNSEELVIDALFDSDEKVRWRAMNGLGALNYISEESTRKLIAIIKEAVPEDKAKAVRHSSKIARLITAIGAMKACPNRYLLEAAILDMVDPSANKRKGFLKRFKKTVNSNRTAVQTAAIATLGKIGSTKSEPFLEKLAKSKSSLSETAEKAANNIKLRSIEALSNTPPTNTVSPVA